MGEYEKREYYDDIDSKYAAYWFKLLIQKSELTTELNINNSSVYDTFTCDKIDSSDTKKETICQELWKKYNVLNLYITNYDLTKFKQFTEQSSHSEIFTRGLIDYVFSLPTYAKKVSLNNAKYRLILEYQLKNDPEKNAYSTIEVKGVKIK